MIVLKVLGCIIGAIVVAFIIALIILWAVASESWDRFNCRPDKIYTADGTYYYTHLIMKFNRWKQLFELNPSDFMFVRCSGDTIGKTYISSSYKEANPVFYNSDEKKYYLVSFRYLDYIKYYFYQREIQNRLSFASEEKITKAIVGDVQSKIDALVAESEKNINDTLKLQEKIILRMSNESSKEGNNDIT